MHVNTVVNLTNGRRVIAKITNYCWIYKGKGNHHLLPPCYLQQNTQVTRVHQGVKYLPLITLYISSIQYLCCYITYTHIHTYVLLCTTTHKGKASAAASVYFYPPNCKYIHSLCTNKYISVLSLRPLPLYLPSIGKRPSGIHPLITTYFMASRKQDLK